jgi:hypothetical protein
MNIPKKILIIPYRDREIHKKMFIERMNNYFENEKKSIEMYFIHQKDNRSFNRGAMKNIGFLAMKKKYPNHYKDISFIFHDVDTLPRYNNMFPYDTVDGVVAHYYGVTFALSSIFVIKGKDFEKVKGFPNYWGWGFEDNSINNRAMVNKLTIDRSTFWHIGNKNIIQLFDSCARSILVENKKRYISDSKKKDYSDGLSTITNLNYNINNDMINIKTFDCKTTYNPDNISDVNFFTTQKNNMFKMKNANLNQGNTTTMNNDKNKKVITTTKTKPLNNKSRFKMF